MTLQLDPLPKFLTRPHVASFAYSVPPLPANDVARHARRRLLRHQFYGALLGLLAAVAMLYALGPFYLVTQSGVALAIGF